MKAEQGKTYIIAVSRNMKPWKPALIIVALIASALPVQSQWAANRIWQSADGPQNTWRCFRKTMTLASDQSASPEGLANSPWKLSVQYLGLTYHPDGGATPELYPLKFDRHAYLVLDIGAVGKLDYRLGKYFFARFTSGLYLDCALLMAGCVHVGPRMQYSLGKNSINIGIGPIFSFRQDWHRFEQFEDDDFYGKRVYKGWQYRLYGTALELEYLRKINESMELEWSLIPGAPLVITFMFGVRFKIPFQQG